MNQPDDMPSAGNMEEWLKWAETKVALSLAVSFFFKPPASAFMEGLLGCYREYLDLCGPHLQWYGSETSSKYREATPKVLEIPFRRLPEAIHHGKFWAWMAYSGEDYRDAAAFQFEAVVTNDPDDLSSFRAAFPVTQFGQDMSQFVALVRRFAERVPFFFGYGGFSFSESQEGKRQQVNEVYLVPAAMRFAGVEVESHRRTRLCCKDSVKGASWLTLLSPPFVQRLGGKAALRAECSEGITLHELTAGLLIQAGPAPGLGDVNAEDRLPLYREVHHALTPVRNLNHWPLGNRAFWQDETRRWMSRFDD